MAACLICGGVVGLLLAAVGTRRGARPSRRRVLIVVWGTVVQAALAGAFAVLGPGAQMRPCGAAGEGGGVWQTARTVVNAPVSGAALLFAAGEGGEMFHCAANGTTAVVLDDGFARAGTMYGTVFLTDQRAETQSPRMRRLSEHEARHSDQWALGSLLAGPAAFPALYAADELVFPGAYNHFERAAGLEDGGYDPPPDSPPVAGRLAILSVGVLVGYILAVSPTRRRRPPRAPVRPEPEPEQAPKPEPEPEQAPASVPAPR
ncbi:hypothetical protein O7599_36410 [Streptomyces sp. WMMC500]|uniref:hypothetical protein n=1 Tax=Streptomyces sp. WMMC500 TaxID=3015154 RepID=UPI00248B6ED4|nr:hypothetical protein [Streptomyces sp. WMMC500]WBB60909.1 hypothetical protein O7599_36410 [Streptomyces sp. WMMC500]